PEQARGEPVSPQTDIYSFGVVLYEVLAGKPPFPGISPVEQLYKHLNEPLPPLTHLPAEVLDAVNAVIQMATAKDPARRYADVGLFASAFRDAVQALELTSNDRLVEALTQREQDILARIIEGLSNKQIAEDLFISLPTVKWYIRHIYSKLGVHSRVQAIVRARELNLIVSSMSDVAPTVLESRSALIEPTNPFKGLQAFQSVDYDRFFGREALTEKLLKRMAESPRTQGTARTDAVLLEANRARLLAILGPSGTGKSSLVKAGLIPALWRGELPGSEKWFVVEMRPGTRPFDELEIVLSRVTASTSVNLHEQLQRDQWGLLRAAEMILPADDSELVLVIDQFEEVFTLVAEESTRTRFLDMLVATVTDPRSRLQVVITLRADFYDRPLRYPRLGDIIQSRMVTVLPLTPEGLERAIVKPAEAVGVRFEEGLVASIAAEMNYQPGALPLLQYALTELFERRQGRLLTQDAYREIGGAVGALAKRAEQLYAELSVESQDMALQMFLRLVILGDSNDDARRRTSRAELLSLAPDSDMMDELIDTFAAYRLLTLDNDAGTRSPTVEVAHEAILREWRRLSTWIEESREDIKMRQQLDRTAEEWIAQGKEVSYLASGQRLEQFAGWASDKRRALTALERAYIEASLAERQQQNEAEAARQQHETKLERRSRTVLRSL
ncbi:MAG: LuxR C-terminal-related transcriptional regulator, partial [Chloroflexota bacterium]